MRRVKVLIYGVPLHFLIPYRNVKREHVTRMAGRGVTWWREVNLGVDLIGRNEADPFLSELKARLRGHLGSRPWKWTNQSGIIQLRGWVGVLGREGEDGEASLDRRIYVGRQDGMGAAPSSFLLERLTLSLPRYRGFEPTTSKLDQQPEPTIMVLQEKR